MLRKGHPPRLKATEQTDRNGIQQNDTRCLHASAEARDNTHRDATRGRHLKINQMKRRSLLAGD